MSANILIVEDDEAIRSLFGEVLSRQGYSTISVGTGEEAITYLFKDPSTVDLVILDMDLPVRSGDRVYADLKKINPEVKILITSAHWLENEVKYVIDDAEGFLKIPFSNRELISVVSRILEEKEGKVPEEGGIRYTRIPVMYEATYNYEDISGSGYITDISERGVSLQTEQLFAVSDELETMIKISEDFTPKFKGIIRNTRGNDLGIEILEMDKEFEDKYRKHVHELIQLRKQRIFEVYRSEF